MIAQITNRRNRNHISRIFTPLQILVAYHQVMNNHNLTHTKMDNKKEQPQFAIRDPSTIAGVTSSISEQPKNKTMKKIKQREPGKFAFGHP